MGGAVGLAVGLAGGDIGLAVGGGVQWPQNFAHFLWHDILFWHLLLEPHCFLHHFLLIISLHVPAEGVGIMRPVRVAWLLAGA